MQDAYTDVGGRQCLEHIVEQLPVNTHLLYLLNLIIFYDDFRKLGGIVFGLHRQLS